MKSARLFVKSAFLSFSSKAATLISGFLYTLIIANFLGPENYGLINLYLGFASLMVIMLGNEAISETLVIYFARFRSKKLFLWLIKLQLALIAIILPIVFLLAGNIADFFAKGSQELVQTVSLLILFAPFTFIFEAVFKGFKSFENVLKFAILESLTNLACAFVFVVLLKMGIFGVVYAKIISISLLILGASFTLLKMPFKKEFPVQEVKDYLKKAVVFIFFKRANLQLIVVYLGVFISPLFLGFYYLLDKIANYAIAVPMIALNDVLLPFASAEKENNKLLGSLMSRALRTFSLLIIVTGVMLMLFANLIFGIFFPAYLGAVPFLLFFIAIYLMHALGTVSILFRVKNRVDKLIKGQIMLVAFTSTIGLYLTMTFDFVGILTTIIAGYALYFIYLIFNLKSINISINLRPQPTDITFLLDLAKQTLGRIKNKTS